MQTERANVSTKTMKKGYTANQWLVIAAIVLFVLPLTFQMSTVVTVLPLALLVTTVFGDASPLQMPFLLASAGIGGVCSLGLTIFVCRRIWPKRGSALMA